MAVSHSPQVDTNNGQPQDFAPDDACFRAIVSNFAGLVSLVNADHIILYQSPSVMEALGYAPAEILGADAFDFIHPEDLPEVAHEFAKLLTREFTATPTYRVRHLDGTWRWLESICTNLIDDPHVQAIVVTSQDVTERKRAEERQRALVAGLRTTLTTVNQLPELPSLEALLRQAVELMRQELGIERCGIFLIEENGTHIRGTFGTDLQGQTADISDDRFPITDWETYLQPMQPQKNRWHLRVDDVVIDWDGTPLPSGKQWSAATPIQSSQGPIGIVSNDTNITGTPLDPVQQEVLAVFCSLLGNIILRKRAQDELRASEERFQAILDNAANVSVYMKDAAGRYLIVNRGFEQAYGHTREEILGHTDYDLASPTFAAGFRAHDQRILQLREPLCGEEQATTYDGQAVTYLSCKFPLYDATGRAYAVCGVSTDITDRKQVEEALRLTEERFKAFMDNSPILAFIKDEAGRYVYFNRTLERTFKVTLQELVGKTNYYRLPREVADKLHENDRRVFETGQPLEAIEPVPTPDGVVHDWLTFKFLVHDAQQRPLIGGVAIDVTERQQAIAALRQSETRFRRLTQANIIGVIIADFEGQVQEANDIFLHMIGYSRDELESGAVHWEQITAPEYHHLSERAFSQMRESAVSIPWESQYLSRDGRRVPVLIGATLLEDSQDQFIAFIIDLTERKLAEEREHAIATGLQTVLAIADELLTCPDVDRLLRRAVELGRQKLGLERCGITLINKQTGVLLGTYGTNRYGQTTDERHHQFQQPTGWMGNILDWQQGQDRWVAFEDRMYTEWNGERYVPLNKRGWIAATPIQSRVGTLGVFFNDSALSGAPLDSIQQNLVVVYCSLLGNILESKRSEAEIRTLNEELEDRVKERTGQLHLANQRLENQVNERLRAEMAAHSAREEAEDANQAKSQFLANMSHEIRTPMNGVLGPLELLMNAGLATKQQRLAEIAYSSARSLLAIIDDILDLSKIEAGKLAIEPIPFDLLALVEETVAMMAVRAEDKGLDLILRYPPQAPRYIIGDPGRIRQVLVNLISNAIKFTAQGHVLINIEEQDPSQALEEAEANGFSLLRCTVQDTGIGIPPDKIEDMFGRFTQADNSTTRRFGGTGLGLAISKQLIELMGGTIGVASQASAGSTFWFTLRLPLQQAPVTHQGEVKTQLPTVDFGNLRALIVDDNELNRQILSEQLNSWGIRSTSCASGQEALSTLEHAVKGNDPFHIAILDHQMPDMDGEALSDAIKMEPELAETVLILLTSMGQQQNAPSRPDKFATSLPKPVRQAELFTALAQAWLPTSGLAVAPPPALPPSNRIEATITQADSTEETGGAVPHVLVAEDNTTNQQVALLALQNLGCQVDIAEDGQEALKKLEASSYDIIFMDCEMPQMDGLEATAAIRHLPNEKKDIPIIAVTAKSTEQDRAHCLQAGMNDYISKPVQIKDYIAMFQRWMPQAKLAATHQNTATTSAPSVSASQDPTNTSNGTTIMESSAAPGDPAVANETPPADLPTLDIAVVAQLRKMAQARATQQAARQAAQQATKQFNDLIAAFLQDAQARLTAMQQARASHNPLQLGKEAHALKGACGIIGARRMADIAANLQTINETVSWPEADALIKDLEQELNRLQLEIEELLHTPKSTSQQR